MGRKTTHRVTNTQNWGFHESEEENLIIHFRAVSSVKGIFWNGAQKKPWRLFAFEPDLVEYIAFSLDFMATRCASRARSHQVLIVMNGPPLLRRC